MCENFIRLDYFCTVLCDFYLFFVGINYTDESTTMPTASDNNDASAETEKPNKIVYKLEPCDKVATLYVMHQNYEPPTDTDYLE